MRYSASGSPLPKSSWASTPAAAHAAHLLKLAEVVLWPVASPTSTTGPALSARVTTTRSILRSLRSAALSCIMNGGPSRGQAEVEKLLRVVAMRCDNAVLGVQAQLS